MHHIRSFYQESDLDVYVPCRHTGIVAKWLLENHYEIQWDEIKGPSEVDITEISQRRTSRHELSAGSYACLGIEEVVTFTHQLDVSLKVQLIVVKPSYNPLVAILDFHSSKQGHLSYKTTI